MHHITENALEQNTTNPIKNLLNALSIPLLLKFIFHPFIDFNNELNALLIGKHPEKSLFRTSAITIFGITGIVLFNNSQIIHIFCNTIITSLNLPTTFIPILSAAISIVLFSNIGSYISQTIAKICCSLFFGDPDFYITKQQLTKLEKKFKLQGHKNIAADDILQVIHFCRHHLRKKSRNALGAKPEDWRQTLEAIIYDADLEHFLDQQQALKNKVLAVQNKHRVIAGYFNATQSKTAKIPTTPETTMFNKTFSIISNNSSSSSISTERMAELELQKFKTNYANTITAASEEEILIHDCKLQLQHRKSSTSMTLCPEHLIHSMICIPKITTPTIEIQSPSPNQPKLHM